jgi:hypothetical protein
MLGVFVKLIYEFVCKKQQNHINNPTYNSQGLPLLQTLNSSEPKPLLKLRTALRNTCPHR